MGPARELKAGKTSWIMTNDRIKAITVSTMDSTRNCTDQAAPRRTDNFSNTNFPCSFF